MPFSFYDDQSLLTTVDVNQKLAPTGMTTAGSTWQKLATVSVTSGALRVEVTGANLSLAA